MTSLLEWISELPGWARFLPFLVLLVINALVYFSGYVNLWLVIACVLSLVVAIAASGGNKGGYNF